MTRLIDLTGRRFARLTVVRFAGWDKNRRNKRWECVCDCGGSTVATTSALQKGRSRSCGCLVREVNSALHGKHRESSWCEDTPEYSAWKHMKQRCSNPNTINFHNYGGRGIRVCSQWVNDYSQFLSDVGRRPSSAHSLDRIDNDGNYEPGNVRWATPKEQANNRKRGKAA
jgi:hypothetical protein